MLTTYPYMSTLPKIPSPLSPRSANIYGRPRFGGFMSDKEGEQNVPFSKRSAKKAPSPKSEDLKERRRKIFLKKIRDEREEARFESRGEDIMRLDFVQRQKQWEAELVRDAPQIPSDPPEEEYDEAEYDLPTSSSNAMQISTQHSLPEEEADEAQQREDEELAALLENLPEYEDDLEAQSFEQSQQNLWSDDYDYDALFSEFMVDQGAEQEPMCTLQQFEGEEMDMS